MNLSMTIKEPNILQFTLPLNPKPSHAFVIQLIRTLDFGMKKQLASTI